eukprot:9481413-Pyramimonas_sp.AAC.1
MEEAQVAGLARPPPDSRHPEERDDAPGWRPSSEESPGWMDKVGGDLQPTAVKPASPPIHAIYERPGQP